MVSHHKSWILSLLSLALLNPDLFISSVITLNQRDKQWDLSVEERTGVKGKLVNSLEDTAKLADSGLPHQFFYMPIFRQ